MDYGVYLRVLRQVDGLGQRVSLYIGLVVFHVLFRILNMTALVPVLNLIFGADKDRPKISELPIFSFSKDYFVDFFYYYFDLVVSNFGTVGVLYFISAIMFLSVVIANSFLYVSSLILTRIRIAIVAKLRKNLFSNLCRLDQFFFDGSKKGDIISKAISDIQLVEFAVENSFNALFKNPPIILGFLLFMLYLSPQLTLLSMIWLPSIGIVVTLLSKGLKRRTALAQESLSRLTQIIDEFIFGIRIVKAFNLVGLMKKKFHDEVDVNSMRNYKVDKRFRLTSPMSEFLGACFVCALLIVGGSMVLKDSLYLSGAEFMTFLIVVSQTYRPVKLLSAAVGYVHRGAAAAENIFKIIDMKPTIVTSGKGVDIASLDRSITYEDVSWGQQGVPILSGVDFTMNKGTITAIVGPSGGGKSSIANLLPRLYDPTGGRILIDGRDIRDISISSLRGLIGMVSQESVLFHDTIYQNIAYGKPEASEQEVFHSAKIANASEFIEAMPEGFATVIGDRGMKLSGGEKQRITIARAILKNPPILILDEATSSLDNESEKLVNDAIRSLMKNRTTLLIAHRFSTIWIADEIIVIDQGKIQERGTHEQLVGKGGLYKRLLDLAIR